ncbi:hypothetical protein LWC34_44930 [Kibdelosporangium philippinense]|uniref:S-adenosyl methyltransferase n=1 Tax=Kibdelosporangium philippinense TaxID=211113 RepID=A0ABS8ZU01_9PSEU|nr:hypothetical protein [Kibdelosporangium philippinense]MCE7009903.1 hypothetical protein [Kibdelosporangium philippinense]
MWACDTATNPDANWPAPIIARIVESFSKPQEHVTVLAWPTTRDASTEPDNDAIRAAGRDSLTAVMKIAEDLDRAARVVHVPRASSPTEQTASSMSGNLAVKRADLADPSHDDVLNMIDTEPASTDLLIASVRPEHTDTSELLAHLAAHSLRVGGILTVFTHCDWSRGELTDPTGRIVTAGQNADLLYLQHIIALHTPIRDGHIATTVDGRDAAEHARTRHRAVVRGLPAPHLRVHSDILVFAQPHDHKPPPMTPATAARETGVIQ